VDNKYPGMLLDVLYFSLPTSDSHLGCPMVTLLFHNAKALVKL
jgi:hypothetical protein